jgi:hypothetical protein
MGVSQNTIKHWKDIGNEKIGIERNHQRRVGKVE